MNKAKRKAQLLAAILLLLVIVFMVWYVLFYMPDSGSGPDGTLVSNFSGKLVVS